MCAVELSTELCKVFPLLYSRQIRDTVNMVICEQMLVNYISLFKDAYWPGGKLAPHGTVRTDSERLETKEQARQKLLDNIPGERQVEQQVLWRRTLIIFLSHFFLSDALINLVGQQNARNGIIKVFNALQETSANKHLLYVSVHLPSPQS